MESIFDKLPYHLHLARNQYAPESDRWRLYNTSHKIYLERTGAATPEECIQKYLDWTEEERKKMEKLNFKLFNTEY